MYIVATMYKINVNSWNIYAYIFHLARKDFALQTNEVYNRDYTQQLNKWAIGQEQCVRQDSCMTNDQWPVARQGYGVV